ncbi:MAG: SDR family oxidoreductase [Hyphomicrobiaceae bacterium]|nr:SDR family oxidoreductase [Hyphomicrobiaceae bacterium]
MSTLNGRVAVVTGSARNIGRATALMLAREGARIMVHARSDAAGVEETVALVRELGGTAESHLADLSTESGAEGLVAATVEKLGGLDILINNAAIRRNTPITEMTFAEWREVLGSSLDCAFLMTRNAVPHMIRGKWGRIVSLGGISMFRGLAGRAHVSAAKAGMTGMTRCLATELGPHGITVNVVAPGSIDTVRGAAAGARPGASALAGIPAGRHGHPQEIAHVITMLCRPEGAYTTGQTIEVNGGAHYT